MADRAIWRMIEADISCVRECGVIVFRVVRMQPPVEVATRRNGPEAHLLSSAVQVDHTRTHTRSPQKKEGEEKNKQK